MTEMVMITSTITITNIITIIPTSYGMNMVASNEISLDRSLPDTRMPECKDWHYPAELPKVKFYQNVQN